MTLRAETPCTPAVALTRKVKRVCGILLLLSSVPTPLTILHQPSSCLPTGGGHASLLSTEIEMKRRRDRRQRRKAARCLTLPKKANKDEELWFHTHPDILQNSPQYHDGSWHYKSCEWPYNLYHLFEPKHIHSAAKSVRATLAGIDGDMFGSSLRALQCEQSVPENAPLHLRSHQ